MSGPPPTSSTTRLVIRTVEPAERDACDEFGNASTVPNETRKDTDSKSRPGKVWIRSLSTDSLIETETQGSSRRDKITSRRERRRARHLLLPVAVLGLLGLFTVATIDWITGLLGERQPSGRQRVSPVYLPLSAFWAEACEKRSLFASCGTSKPSALVGARRMARTYSDSSRGWGMS